MKKETDTMKDEFLKAFEEYGDAIFRFCIVKTSNKELAEDLTQETFMRFWRALADGKKMRNSRSFLYTIANHLIIDWYRKKKTTSLDSRMEAGFQPTEEKGDDTGEPAEYKEALESMQGLSEGDKEILLLRHIEGLPPKEIGKVLDIPANVASIRIHRATKRLKKKMNI